ncbi:unnamed protein product [Adineta ricciae]|uniref:Pentapeptide repeat-containing protein n=1 Tax=Adineta ricciae TaxID=249248 RepID=A0A815G2N2_ADIRI|nr:unnamed protein product [Adineta ricciae]CAF1553979.1 unnamed protein product [Adineta ricciae]
MKRAEKRSSHLNLLKILFAAFPTIVFGVFTVVFTLQQNASAKAAREQDQRQADETNQRIIFKEYIDDMKELLLDKYFAQNMTRSLLHIRVQTLTALKSLDTNRKRDIIIFLYENHLIRHDKSPRIELRGADLTNVKFGESSIETCLLTNLYLPGIYAKGIIFDGCDLAGARFDDALMNNAQFYSCILYNATFVRTNLTNAKFYDNYIFMADFSSTLLTKTSIKGGILQGVNLTNADLYKSDINDALMYPLNFGGVEQNEFRNARFPNGSFSDMNTKNLLNETESKCGRNTTVAWIDAVDHNQLAIIHGGQMNVGNDCFFVLDHRDDQIALLPVRTQEYSLLIDLEQAKFNLSALIGLENTNTNTNDEVMMTVHFAQDKGGFDSARSARKSIRNQTSIQFHSFIHDIIPKTRHLYISFSCTVVSGTKNQQCLFDQVEISISKKDI